MSTITSPRGSISSQLTTPIPVRKASFANLARFFGIGGTFAETKVDEHESEHDEECDGEPDVEEVDEESLMWDAQAALIAHQPPLAIKRYTTAALPPHRSAAACLALGNLLTRGTGFTSPETPPPHNETPLAGPFLKGKERATACSSPKSQTISPVTSPSSPPIISRFLHTFFNSDSNSAGRAQLEMPPPTENKYDLVGNGWAMRTEGKRAVRDVEGMGIAGGWLVLGVGWIVDTELHRQTNISTTVPSIRISTQRKEVMFGPQGGSDSTDEDMLVMGSRAKSRSIPVGIREAECTGADDDSNASTAISQPPSVSDVQSETTSTADTVESTVLKTPFSETGGHQRDYACEVKTLKLIYDLLQPLLHLYRHGHIQASDPVFLPPIASAQLPTVLRPVRDMQKRRNAWALGAVVAGKLLQLDALRDASDLDDSMTKNAAVREWKQLSCGVKNLASYILGMTDDRHLREGYFRSIIANGPCGLSTADNIVRQAAKRLDIIAKTPSEPPTPSLTTDGYPFPQMSMLNPASANTVRASRRARQSPSGRKHRKGSSTLAIPSAPRHQSSTASLRSMEEGSGILPMPALNSSSSVSEGTGHGYSSSAHEDSPVGRPSALENLRQVSDRSLRSHAAHHRNRSRASMLSNYSRAPAPAVLSAASIANEVVPAQVNGVCIKASSASESLRKARAASSSDLKSTNDRVHWPNLADWTMAKSPPLPATEMEGPASVEAVSAPTAPLSPIPAVCFLNKPESSVRTVASSPDISAQMHLSPKHAHTRSLNTGPRSKPSSASLLGGDTEIAQIDPTLAAAELASALTKHVCCSVCAAKGVNFPECRKCGMRFCSRDCRVGQAGAGDGKRHLCGAWESRKRNTKMQSVTEGSEMGLEKAGEGSLGESLGKTPTSAGVRAF